MKKINPILVLAAASLVAACNDNGNTWGPSGPTANFQVLHASPDAPSIGVLVDGQPAFDELHFSEGTGELAIAAGPHTITFEALSAGGATTIGTPLSVNFQQGNDYVIVAEGPVATLTAATFPHVLSTVAATSTRVQFVHALPGGPAVDVYVTAPGAALGGGTVTPFGGASVSFGGAAGPTDLPAGQYELRVTPAGATSPVLFDSGAITLQGGTDLVIAALPNSGPGPSQLFLSVTDASGDSAALYDTATQANVRVVNAAPQSTGLDFTVAAGGATTTLATGVAFEGFSASYQSLAPDASYTIGIAAAGSPGTALATAPFAANAGGQYTVFALGDSASLATLATWDSRRRVATEAKLRVFDASPGAGVVDVYVTAPGTGLATTSPTFPGMSLGADTGMQGFVAGSYTITVTAAGSTTPLVAPFNVTIANAGIYTAVIRDAPGGGAPYGVILMDDFAP